MLKTSRLPSLMRSFGSTEPVSLMMRLSFPLSKRSVEENAELRAVGHGKCWQVCTLSEFGIAEARLDRNSPTPMVTTVVILQRRPVGELV